MIALLAFSWLPPLWYSVLHFPIAPFSPSAAGFVPLVLLRVHALPPHSVVGEVQRDLLWVLSRVVLPALLLVGVLLLLQGRVNPHVLWHVHVVAWFASLKVWTAVLRSLAAAARNYL